MRADENSSLKLSIEKAVFSPFSIFLTVTSPFAISSSPMTQVKRAPNLSAYFI